MGGHDAMAGRGGDRSSFEERLSLFVLSVRDYAIFMLDPHGRVTSWNPGAERMKGYRAEEILGRHFSVFYPPEDIAADKPSRELLVAATEGRLEDEGWRVRKDGSLYWANVVITALYDDDQLRGFGKVVRDLTERRLAEHTLAERRALFAHLIRMQERERRMIAWEVHHDSIQAMTAVSMRLQTLAASLSEQQGAQLARLDDTVRQAVSRLRALVFGLRPPALGTRGLRDAVSTYLDRVVAQWGFTCTLTCRLDRGPPTETAITAFRIIQEALTNVRKHARATTAHVSITSAHGGLQVQVADDGTGVTTGLPTDHVEHYGLLDMRERAEVAGGWWSLTSQPGEGTTVDFWLPTAAADESRVRRTEPPS